MKLDEKIENNKKSYIIYLFLNDNDSLISVLKN